MVPCEKRSFTVPKKIREKRGLLALCSTAALYAKQLVLLPTQSLLVFTNEPLQWSTHVEAYRREMTSIHSHILYPQDCCYQYSAHCTLTLSGTSFPTMPACICLAAYSAHPHAHANSNTLAHPHQFQGGKWLIADRLIPAKTGWLVPNQAGDAEPQLSSSTRMRAYGPHEHLILNLYVDAVCVPNLQSLFSTHTSTQYMHTMQVSEGGLVRWWIRRRLR